MIGALLVRHGVDNQLTGNIESLDPDRLAATFTDDVVIEFPGREPIVGREAAEAYFRGLFDEIEDEKVTVKGLALTHPYTFGLSNTVLCEVEVTVHYKDGREVTGREVYAFDTEGKYTKAMRYYVGDLAFLEAPQA
jgi:ketosteroid isomerase-like protein